MVDDPASFNVRRVVAKGHLVAEEGRMLSPTQPPTRSHALLSTFALREVQASELVLRTDLDSRRIKALSMEISDDVPFVRKRREVSLPVSDGVVQSDTAQDVLYVAVVERYGKTSNRAIGLISGFGLRRGAMASSASPDDNNVLCIGTSAEDMAVAINYLAQRGGGQVVVRDQQILAFLGLPIGGIVADLAPAQMAEEETRLDQAAREIGCRLKSPFMYMIFLSVTAIPDYAITDRGVIDCVRLEVINPVLGPDPESSTAAAV
jgi:adenine deaminase